MRQCKADSEGRPECVNDSRQRVCVCTGIYISISISIPGLSAQVCPNLTGHRFAPCGASQYLTIQTFRPAALAPPAPSGLVYLAAFHPSSFCLGTACFTVDTD